MAEEFARAKRIEARRKKDRPFLLGMYVLHEAYYFARWRRDDISLSDFPCVVALVLLGCNIAFWVWIFQPMEKTWKRKEGRAFLISIAFNVAYFSSYHLAGLVPESFDLGIKLVIVIGYVLYLLWLWKWG